MASFLVRRGCCAPAARAQVGGPHCPSPGEFPPIAFACTLAIVFSGAAPSRFYVEIGAPFARVESGRLRA